MAGQGHNATDPPRTCPGQAGTWQGRVPTRTGPRPAGLSRFVGRIGRTAKRHQEQPQHHQHDHYPQHGVTTALVLKDPTHVRVSEGSRRPGPDRLAGAPVAQDRNPQGNAVPRPHPPGVTSPANGRRHGRGAGSSLSGYRARDAAISRRGHEPGVVPPPAWTGRRTRSTVRPGRESMPMLPPWRSSTMRRAMSSPSPVPLPTPLVV